MFGNEPPYGAVPGKWSQTHGVFYADKETPPSNRSDPGPHIFRQGEAVRDDRTFCTQ